MRGALSGVKILDLSMNLPGPYLTWLLACLGAEVLKLENPAGGDYGRSIGGEGDSPYFQAVNRGKKSLALNLASPEGREVFFKLLAGYDVLVEGFRPGVLERLGLGYEQASAAQPRLIYLSVNGYGLEGPNRERAGHDINYLALAGVLGMTGCAGGELGLPGVQIADLAGGSLLGLGGLLAALYQREKTGQGQLIDASMFDGSLSLATMVQAGVATGRDDPRPGRMTLNGRYPCYNLYRTKGGGWFSLGALEPKFWQNFCAALERPDLAEQQFGGPEAIQEVAAIFAQRTRSEWARFWNDHDACCEPVLSLDEATESPLARARGMIADTPQGPRLASPLKLSASPSQEQGPAPALGQHTREVLSALGYDDSFIEDMARRKIAGL